MVELQKAQSDTTKLTILEALCNECDIENNLKYGSLLKNLATKLMIQAKTYKEKKKYLSKKLYSIEIISIYYEQESDTSRLLLLLKEGLNSAKQIMDTHNIVNSMKSIIAYYNKIGNRPKALEIIERGIEFSKLFQDRKGLAKFYRLLAEMYEQDKYYLKAIEKYKQELGMLKSISNNKDDLAYSYAQIATVYGRLKNIKKAKENFDSASAIAESPTLKIIVCNREGQMYRSNQRYREALIAFNESVELSKYVDKSFLWGAYANIGDLYSAMNKFDSALFYTNKALNIAVEIKFDNNINGSYQILTDIYFKMGNFKKANEIREKCKMFFNSYSILEKENFYRMGAKIDSASGNWKAAFQNYQQYIFYQNKAKSDVLNKTMVKEKFQREYDKQKEIDRAVSTKEIERQKLVRNSFMLGFILILIIAVLVFRSLLQNRKAKAIIENQKHLVEEKNREILDSIEYALRIQTAILPPAKIVKQYLENSFILYKPKDIVAGDFYWMESINDVVLFAACDCTGHGVPGAMVSVVCHNALNRAVREFGLTQPAAILDKTTEIVLENFAKSEEEIQDGMDISICALNTKTRMLEWAGANNSLIFINNGQLFETKADKQCIGYNDEITAFTNHEFKIESDTIIYLFTDGFADQFGGQPERKLTKRKFKELLISIQHLSIQEQATELDKFITNYKINTEQTDDILVIGVRI